MSSPTTAALAGPAAPAGRELVVPAVAAGVTAAVYELGSSDVRGALPVLLCLAAATACARVIVRGALLPRAWAALAAAMTLFGASFLLTATGAPGGVSGAVLGAAYLPAAYATWLLASRGTSSWTRASFDIALIAGAAAVVNWQLYLRPYLVGTATHGGLPAALQPLIALALLPLMVRSLLSGNRRVPSYSLLLVSAAFSLLANLVLSFRGLRGVVRPTDPAIVLPVLSQLTVLLAALHPRAGQLGPPAVTERRYVLQTLWLAPVGGSLAALPWIAERLRLSPDLALTSAATAVIVVLLVARCVVVMVQAQRQAATDPLTGLASRRAFAARLAEVADGHAGAGGPAAVLFVDLDDFKSVNDAGGHDAGDALLVEVGRRLRACVRPKDLAARLGGDEFAILLDALPAGTTAQTVGERVAAALAEPIRVGGRLASISASVGVVPPQPGMDGEALLTAADIAMYVAKTADTDKGRVQVFTEELRREVQGRRELAAELMEEIGSAPLSSLELHYQPVVSLGSGRPVAVEALLRWRHPSRGLLPAAEFLDLVTTAEAARTLDTFVLHEALRQLANWRRLGGAAGRLSVAVNLGRATMVRPDLVELVTGALARSGAPADQLILEVTEHEGIPDEPEVAAALQALASQGVRLSLDDFGVGYTSLHYLERFPVGILKVDKSFTETALGSSRTALLRGLVALCASAGVVPLAEGVESEEQVRRLRDCGFVLGQGYHFGGAMRPSEVAGWVDRTALTIPAAAPTPPASGISAPCP